jgi:ElaB/YqjD/DUF883 family membrane-anchored ribosome-binding protein
MDETTASEEASENAQEQNAEVEKTASAAGHQVRQTIQTAWQDAKNKISELEIYVREQPTRGVLVAFGLGVVLGLYVRR